MPRFVVIRNVEPDFEVVNFFDGLNIQRDSKSKEKVYRVKVVMNSCGKNYNLAYAQLKTYRDWKEAQAKQSVKYYVEPVEMFSVLTKKTPSYQLTRFFLNQKLLTGHALHMYIPLLFLLSQNHLLLL